jgi:hypothetical protein
MIAVARIARRLVRKLVKPAALWLATFQIAEAEAQADHYMQLRGDLVGMELDMRKHAVVLAARRNEIRTW